jgi:hypothetical protein
MQTLDLKRYQSAKLVEQLTDGLNVGSAVVEVVKTTGWVMGALVVAANLVLYLGGATIGTWALIAIYVLVVGGVLGGAVGLVRVARSFLGQSATVLELMVRITQQARIDLQRVQSGDAQLPSTREIMLHSYHDVMVPTVKHVVVKSGGIVGHVLFWVYQQTIERIVLQGINQTVALEPRPNGSEPRTNPGEQSSLEQPSREQSSREQPSREQPSREQLELKQSLESLADPREDTEIATKAAAWLNAATRQIDRWLLLPLVGAFWATAAVAIVPVLVAWWWSR